jgi:hypothetical protein
MKTEKTDVNYLKRAAEHGPANLKIADGLIGWTTEDFKFICARCASKILGRGCRLPITAEPLWDAQPQTIRGKCCVCDGK